jgi:hypothetical protein
MTVDREAIFAALTSRLSGALAPATVSRKVRHWSEVPPSEQPAAFIEQGDQTGEAEYGKPTKWNLKATVYVYVTDTTAAGPYPALNGLVQAVERALSGAPGERFSAGGPTTLAGLVQSCRVTGVTDSGGALGDQAVAVIDVDILAV